MKHHVLMALKVNKTLDYASVIHVLQKSSVTVSVLVFKMQHVSVENVIVGLKGGEEACVIRKDVPVGVLTVQDTAHVTVQLEFVIAMKGGVDKDVKYQIALVNQTVVDMGSVIKLLRRTALVVLVGWGQRVMFNVLMVLQVNPLTGTIYVNVNNATMVFLVTRNALVMVTVPTALVIADLKVGEEMYVNAKGVQDGRQTVLDMGPAWQTVRVIVIQDGRVRDARFQDVREEATVTVMVHVMESTTIHQYVFHVI